MSKLKLFLLVTLSLSLLGTSACSQHYRTDQGRAKESALTAGMTKKYIRPGSTTQTDVLETFGPPDLITRKGGQEVWTYDKISQEVRSSGGYLTILFAGYGRSRDTSTNKSVMLIIYFNADEVVRDYALSVAKF